MLVSAEADFHLIRREFVQRYDELNIYAGRMYVQITFP